MVSRSLSHDPSRPIADAEAGRDDAQRGGPDEAADYIAGAVADLVAMARLHKLDTLGFLLEMAQIEADDVRLRRIQAQK